MFEDPYRDASSFCYAAQVANAPVAHATFPRMNELELNNHRVERLLAAVDRLSGGNKTDFGKRLGYKDGAFIRQMASGLRPVSEKTIRAIEALPGMRDWFSLDRQRGDDGPQLQVAIVPGGEVAVWNSPSEVPNDRVWVDRWDYRFSAGNGGVQWEIRQKNALPFSFEFFDAIGSRPQDCKLVMVRGDSMEPFLFNKDMAMVDVSKTRLRDGEVYAMIFEEEPIVKQVFKQPRGITLHSYNTKYPDRHIAEEDMDRLQMVGEIVYRSGSGFRY